MKQILIVLIFSLLSIVYTFGQDIIRPHYGGSESLESYPQTNCEKASKIKNAWLPNGQQIIYDGNGYREYEMWGNIRRYYYRNGDCDGLVVFFDTTKTKMNELGFYYKNKKEGPWITFHDNGQISSIITYKNSKAISDYRTYYENASLKSRTIIDSNGVANGSYTEYFDNNIIKVNGKFDLILCDNFNIDSSEFEFQKSIGRITRKSIPVGYWKEYYQNGNIKKEMYYLNKCNLTIGTDTIREGVSSVYLITNACPDGEWKEYDENGILIKTIVYRDCEMVEEKEL